MATNAPAPAPPQRKKKRELTEKERERAVFMLKGMVKDGVLPRGSFTKVGKAFGARNDTIGILWRGVVHNEAQGLSNSPAIRSKRHFRGAKPIYDVNALAEALKEVPKKQRKTSRAAASALGVSTFTIQLMKKKKIVWKHHSRLKPLLTEENMHRRIEHVLDRVSSNNTRTGLFYNDLINEIHIDEKWFYLTRDGEAYILVDGERPPHRTCKHKSHITKVMFLCAMARPRWDNTTNTYWDGKIGIWPVGEFVPAQRASRNRPRGTPVWKNISITRDVYRDLLIQQLLPAVIAKWPVGCGRDILIQQDGAKSHIRADDEEWLAALEETGWGERISLYTQPANSPDLNLNDLGFFRSLQSHYERDCPSNEAGIIDLVKDSFELYDASRINRIWLTLQSVFNCVLLSTGNNDYKLPHMGKDALERQGELPLVLPVDPIVSQYI